MVLPPRIIEPKFTGSTPPTQFDLGHGGQARVSPQAMSIGIPGVFDVNVDEEDGFSVSTPVGGVTVDDDGMAVNVGNHGSVSVGSDGASISVGGAEASIGPDGATVRLPGGHGISIGNDGRISITPGDSTAGASPGTPGAPPIPYPVQTPFTAPIHIPIPIPHFESKPIEIPIPMPRFTTERFDVPVAAPNLQWPPWLQLPHFSLPDLAAVIAQLRGTLVSAVTDAVSRVSDVVTRDPIVEAVERGHMMWKLTARFRDIKVNAAMATGAPGCLVGGDLEPLIRAQLPVTTSLDDDQVLGRAVAEAVSAAFGRWASKVTVPGLPWYPAFVAYPGPMAPPMPNIPTPLIACPSSFLSEIVDPMSLTSAITASLPATHQSAEVKARVQTIALQLARFFTLWLSRQLVMSVMGQGPVPTFAPPNVPAGPVLGGTAEGLPGCLAS